MLTGKELGAAIESARKLKRVTKKALADHFNVKPPTVQDWVNRGTIDKARLPGLWAYFADVVPPEHWGLARYPTDTDQAGSPKRENLSLALANAFDQLPDALPGGNTRTELFEDLMRLIRERAPAVLAEPVDEAIEGASSASLTAREDAERRRARSKAASGAKPPMKTHPRVR
jgi:hypothetical protein